MLNAEMPVQCAPYDVSLSIQCMGEITNISPNPDDIAAHFELEGTLKSVSIFNTPEDCNCTSGKITIRDKGEYVLVLTGLGSHVAHYLGEVPENSSTFWQFPDCTSKVYTVSLFKVEDEGGLMMGGATPPATIASSGGFPFPLLAAIPAIGLPLALSGGSSGGDDIPFTNPTSFSDDSTTTEDSDPPLDMSTVLDPFPVPLADNPLDNPNTNPDPFKPDSEFKPDPDNDSTPVPEKLHILVTILSGLFIFRHKIVNLLLTLLHNEN